MILFILDYDDIGYANEVGEAFRPLVSKYLVLGTYGVAISYALADCADKTQKEYNRVYIRSAKFELHNPPPISYHKNSVHFRHHMADRQPIGLFWKLAMSSFGKCLPRLPFRAW